MRNVLADAGPLIALFKKTDQYRPAAERFFGAYKGVVATTWPVITEVCYMLDYSVERQSAFLTWIERGGLKAVDMNVAAVHRVNALMRTYADQPMALADASIVWLAESTGITDVISVDRRDFAVYRLANGKALTNCFPVGTRVTRRR